MQELTHGLRCTGFVKDRVHANVSKDLPRLTLDLLQARKVRETGIAKRRRITLAASHNQDGTGSRSDFPTFRWFADRPAKEERSPVQPRTPTRTAGNQRKTIHSPGTDTRPSQT